MRDTNISMVAMMMMLAGCLIRSLEMIVVWTSSHRTSERDARAEPLVDAEKQLDARSFLVTSLRN